MLFYLLVLSLLVWCPSALDLAVSTTTSSADPFVYPAISYQWRSKKIQRYYNDTGFPILYPLTIDMIQKGMPSLSPKELHRLLPLMTALSQQQREGEFLKQQFEKQQKKSNDQDGASFDIYRRKHAPQGKNVTVVSLGGSFAKGTQCCEGFAWPHRVVDWLQNAYPLVDIIHLRYLKGSTNSLYGAAVVRELFATTHVDLLLMGYTVNDEAAVIMSGNSTFLSVTEQIIRQAVARNTAVMYLVETIGTNNAGRIYDTICPLYSVPVVSYRKAVRSTVKAAEKLPTNDPMVHFKDTKYSIFWMKYHAVPHPGWLPHQFITELFGYTFTQIVNRLNTKSALVHSATPNFPVKPVFFEDVSSKTMCFPAIVSVSTLNESPEETSAKITQNSIGSFSPSFAPYICSARSKVCKYNHAKYRKDSFALNHGYYKGWSFAQDRPGKPYGWMTSSEGRPDDLNFTYIAFPIVLVGGKVSVTYLSSYENAGILELWISYVWVPHIDYSIMKRKDPVMPGVVGCCDKSSEKKTLYTHTNGLGHSRTTVIDTLQSSGVKASEIRTTTIDFGMTGTFALNLLHRTQSPSARATRGGDKVKVLGIRAC